MNFLIDAHLPRKMAAWLTAAGCDAVHTLDLPDGNRTTDREIIDIADRERRAVVSKDADFVDQHILSGSSGAAPPHLDRQHDQPGAGNPDGPAAS